jgi:hypothetical protein
VGSEGRVFCIESNSKGKAFCDEIKIVKKEEKD